MMLSRGAEPVAVAELTKPRVEDPAVRGFGQAGGKTVDRGDEPDVGPQIRHEAQLASLIDRPAIDLARDRMVQVSVAVPAMSPVDRRRGPFGRL